MCWQLQWTFGFSLVSTFFLISSFVLEIVKARGKIEFFAQALVFVFWMLGLVFLITAAIASCDDAGMLAASGIMLSIMPVILVIALINDCLSNRRYEVV